jgi:hypothetical protein
VTKQKKYKEGAQKFEPVRFKALFLHSSKNHFGMIFMQVVFEINKFNLQIKTK